MNSHRFGINAVLRRLTLVDFVLAVKDEESKRADLEHVQNDELAVRSRADPQPFRLFQYPMSTSNELLNNT